MRSETFAPLGLGSIIGAYRIVREIAHGGMGVVFEANHTILPRRAAIKVMHEVLRRQPGMASRMVQEASILEEVRHPGVVRVFECNVIPDHRPWIAMELVDGETLASRLEYATRLPAVEVASLISEVADVLAAVHPRGIVHRDLKPDNVLLTPIDRDYPLRVIDWGVARLGPGRLTLEGLTPGTPIYMSPEQAIGRNIGPGCDIYSLGVMAYEALAGQPPFDGRTLAEVVSMHLASDAVALADTTDAPHELCELVHRMLEKDPRRRPRAIELRDTTRRLARELSSAYEHFEVSGLEPVHPPRGTRGSAVWFHEVVPDDEVVVVDPESLELGSTELMPTVPKPRWTPAYPSRAITPRVAGDSVAGEFVLKPRL